MKTKKQNPPKGGTLTEEQINWLNECTTGTFSEGTWKLNPQTGLVDVDGSFNCSKQDLSDFKGVRFGVVERHFSCSDNRLTSLEGAPQEVRGDFHCWHNPVPERTLESIFSLMRKGASYEEVLRRKWKRYSHKTKSLLYRAEYQWIPQEEHKMLSALNKVNSVLNWIWFYFFSTRWDITFVLTKSNRPWRSKKLTSRDTLSVKERKNKAVLKCTSSFRTRAWLRTFRTEEPVLTTSTRKPSFPRC